MPSYQQLHFDLEAHRAQVAELCNRLRTQSDLNDTQQLHVLDAKRARDSAVAMAADLRTTNEELAAKNLEHLECITKLTHDVEQRRHTRHKLAHDLAAHKQLIRQKNHENLQVRAQLETAMNHLLEYQSSGRSSATITSPLGDASQTDVGSPIAATPFIPDLYTIPNGFPDI